ncbi:MAG: hypothetical protein Q8M76_11150 [Spirochaetaceae bacterium]|nr:hypothetical protein [Spirochaetaceae bacterium]
MKKIMIAGCVLAALIVLGACAPKGEMYDENTASGYDYVQDNMKISDGKWANNWVTSFDPATKAFVPALESRRYEGLTIYLGKIHSTELIFDVAKPDGPVYVEIYLVYTGADGADVAELMGQNVRGNLMKDRIMGWNAQIDFDNLPPTTKALKVKVQKGRETLYLDAIAPE